MYKLFCLLVVLLCIHTATCQLYGVATLAPTGFGAAYNVTGTVRFYQENADSLVQVTVNLTGSFEARNYAIHVHTFGDLTFNFNGTSVGTHYIGRGSANHSCPENGTSARHEGDMGNWLATTTGISGVKTLNLLTLYTNYSIIGRAVVLHIAPDNCTAQPSGAAGNYIAFGAIGIQNATTNIAVNTDSAIGSAVAVLYPTNLAPNFCNGLCFGAIYLIQNPTSITVIGAVYNLASTNPHGIHVHTFGDLTTPNDGLSVGGHWNPTAASHGLPGTNPRHFGDLGNIQSFDSNGTAYYQADFPTTEVGTLSSIMGRGIVVHALNDKGNGANCDQAGGSGSRILWGVIGAQNPAAPPAASIPVGLTINNNYTALPCTTASPTSNPAASESPYYGTGAGSLLTCWLSLLF